MVNKKKLITILILFIIGLSGIIFYFYTNASRVGTITQNFQDAKEHRSTISFHGLEGEYLTFHLSSNITEGETEFFIIDSTGNPIGSFGQDIAEKKIALEKDDTFEVVALSKSLVGKLKLKIYKH